MDETIVGLLLAAFDRLQQEQDATLNGEALREWAIAKTSIEDAIMRTNRGFARVVGIFFVSDVEAGL